MSRLHGGRQLQKCDEYLFGGQAPRPDIHSLPTHDGVNTEDVRALPLCEPRVEVRRRDVGVQRYGSGVPTLPQGFHESLQTLWNSVVSRDLLTDRPGGTSIHQTSIGPIKLTDPHPRRDLGSMPTGDTFNFLKHEYQGSRFQPPKPRYYS